MTSPFVRRRRLGAELRTLREQSGMTADELARRIYRSRMTISKLENARCRPDIGDIVKIMKILGVTGDRFDALFKIACDAAERGWWDNYGDAMGPRQRMYADLESGATSIRGYNQFGVPGILQTSEFSLALIELDKADGPLDYHPDRMMAARRQRQEIALGANGPSYELVLDEFVIRRLAVPASVMSRQLAYLIEKATNEPRLTVHVLPIDARVEGGFLARSTFSIYTFPDEQDPQVAVADTVNTDVAHTDEPEVARYVELYRRLRDASLSAVSSLTLLEQAAKRLSRLAES
ncbi:helix-turn-helix domain-containing protein [Actinomadura welshii]|uniref:helix-turn-helix domain-containing protein n=1 Tax=Actinomadura welshii TaxID=3103817 RepID=UPI0003AD5596|nr:helix-turn-helix transcriptional regulator [Actinomadura madurae]